jgi:ureidoacrylate peracid hydrolase
MLREQLVRGGAALLVIDMQNDFCDADGVLGKRGIDLAATQAMAPRLANFIASIRAAHLPILYTQTLHDTWTDAFAWQERQDGRAGALCRTSSWGADFFGILPRDDERVVGKHRYDAFYGTDLDLILRARSINTLLLTGVATNVCVETTAREAFVRGYRLVMVADCLAGTSANEHEATLRTMERYFAAVVTTSGAVAEALGAP